MVLGYHPSGWCRINLGTTESIDWLSRFILRSCIAQTVFAAEYSQRHFKIELKHTWFAFFKLLNSFSSTICTCRMCELNFRAIFSLPLHKVLHCGMMSAQQE